VRLQILYYAVHALCTWLTQQLWLELPFLEQNTQTSTGTHFRLLWFEIYSKTDIYLRFSSSCRMWCVTKRPTHLQQLIHISLHFCSYVLWSLRMYSPQIERNSFVSISGMQSFFCCSLSALIGCCLFGKTRRSFFTASLSLSSSTALWTLVAFSVSSSYTQSVGLLGRGISPSQGLYLYREQRKHRINAHKHPCLEWDSNPRSQRSRGLRRFILP
jgi:hypothetical protein